MATWLLGLAEVKAVPIQPGTPTGGGTIGSLGGSDAAQIWEALVDEPYIAGVSYYIFAFDAAGTGIELLAAQKLPTADGFHLLEEIGPGTVGSIADSQIVPMISDEQWVTDDATGAQDLMLYTVLYEIGVLEVTVTATGETHYLVGVQGLIDTVLHGSGEQASLGLFYPFAAADSYAQAEALAHEHIEQFSELFIPDGLVALPGSTAPASCTDTTLSECERSCRCNYDTAKQNCKEQELFDMAACRYDILPGAGAGCVAGLAVCRFLPPASNLMCCGLGSIIGATGAFGICVANAHLDARACERIARNNFVSCMALNCGIIVVEE